MYPEAISQAKLVKPIVYKAMKWREEARFTYDYYRNQVAKLSPSEKTTKADDIRIKHTNS